MISPLLLDSLKATKIDFLQFKTQYPLSAIDLNIVREHNFVTSVK